MVTIQKISARNWELNKEKFIEYANDKLDMKQSLDLSKKDQINILATDIRDLNIRAVALTVVNETLEFLERMRIITEELGNNSNYLLRSNPSRLSSQKFNSVVRCSNCQRKGHLAKDCRSGKIICYKCNQEGHISTQCPLAIRAQLERYGSNDKVRGSGDQNERNGV